MFILQIFRSSEEATSIAFSGLKALKSKHSEEPCLNSFESGVTGSYEICAGNNPVENVCRESFQVERSVEFALLENVGVLERLEMDLLPEPL